MMNETQAKNNFVYILSAILIVLGITARLFPHPANFAPIGAVALFGGLYLPKKWSILIPLVALGISDLFIGFYHPMMMLSVYTGFGLMAYLGALSSHKKKLNTIISAVLLGSIIFFLITNAAVWAFGTMYPKTIAGLWQSYTMAIPFFRNSLLGDFFFTGVLVGSAELLTAGYAQIIKKMKEAHN